MSITKERKVEMKNTFDNFVVNGNLIEFLIDAFLIMTTIVFVLSMIQTFGKYKYFNGEKWFSVIKAVASAALIFIATCVDFKKGEIRWFKVPDMTFPSALSIILAMVEIASAFVHILQPETKEEQLEKLEREVRDLRLLCDEIKAKQVEDMVKFEKKQKKSYDVTVKIIK